MEVLWLVEEVLIELEVLEVEVVKLTVVEVDSEELVELVLRLVLVDCEVDEMDVL